MQRIGTFTKIHGSGNIEFIMNNILNKEIMRQRELERKEMNRMESRHNKYLREKLAALNAKPCERKWYQKIADGFIFALACIICWLEDSNLIKYEGRKEK